MDVRKKTIQIPIFNSTLIIVFDKDLSWTEKKYKTRSLKCYDAVTLKDESKCNHYVVSFASNKRSNIAHEIVHVINYIFIDCGIMLDRENDETQAYLTGWLFDEIDKFINN